jgi:hypothetical protein
MLKAMCSKLVFARVFCMNPLEQNKITRSGQIYVFNVALNEEQLIRFDLN